ncbi:MAG TPA: type II CAAX endopeptidase family protein [Candidatus Hydrogenedentes bacterium]|nr:type II CAAX endopeptidase family protein [Candidatus Hydrogenedentota bacterium]
MTRPAFIVLLAFAAGWGLVRAWRARQDYAMDGTNVGGRRDLIGMAIQTPLFFLAVWFAWNEGALSRVLFAPAPWLLGLVAGHLIFAGSLLVTHGHLEDVIDVLSGPIRVVRFATGRFDLTLRTFAVAFTEELIFREAAQRAVLHPWIGAVPGILVTAACFVAVHEHLFRNTPRGLVEFAGFALLLGVLYHASDSLALVTAVHAARNLESSWLEEECGDSGQPDKVANHPVDAIHGTG